MNGRRWVGAARAAALVSVLLLTGCAYMSNRGYDALRMFDAGITVTSSPYFAFYPGNYFNSTPMGYSGVHGRYLGIAHGQFGNLRFDDESWGALLWGSEEFQIGDLNPADPQQFSPEEFNELKKEGKPLPATSPRYNVGVVRMVAHDNAPPPLTFLACRRNIHLGWIGVHLSMHPANILDFMLGWMGHDLMKNNQFHGWTPATPAPSTGGPPEK